MMQQIRKKIKHRFSTTLRAVNSFVHAHPYWAGVIVVCLYMLCFRLSFLTHGDAWAESFAEYLDESLKKGWSEVFAQNWAGYYTLVPSFLAKLITVLPYPLGYVDFFFRYIAVIFAVSSVSLLAARANRWLIANDYLRILLTVLLIAALPDLASFSFINIWYIGLIPLVALYINPAQFRPRNDAILGLYGTLLALTKPFLVMIPLSIWRAFKSRQYLGPSLVLAASGLQAYQILFNDTRGLTEQSHLGLAQVVGGLFMGTGTAVLKLLHVVPNNIWYVVLANVLLAIMFWYVLRKRGIMTALILASILLYSVFTYVLPPDAQVYHGLESFQSMYYYVFKSQREILINGIILLVTFIDADILLAHIRQTRTKQRHNLLILFGAACLLVFVAVQRPLDTTSSAVSNRPIDVFRTDLTDGTPACVPLSPTQTYIREANWFFSYKGVCTDIGHDLNLFKPDFTKMNIPAKQQTLELHAQYFRVNDAELVTLVVPVRNDIRQKNHLLIKDNMTGKVFRGSVAPTNGDVQFVTIRFHGLPKQNNYTLRIDQERPGLRIGYFASTNTPISYAYFLAKE